MAIKEKKKLNEVTIRLEETIKAYNEKLKEIAKQDMLITSLQR